MNKFIDTLWQGLAILIILLVMVFVGWYIVTTKKENPVEIFRRAYGEIKNPTKKSDKSRADAIRNALSVMWES